MPSFSGMVKANDDGACLRLAHAQVENEIPAGPSRAPRRCACVSTLDCARSPYGEIHIQTKSTFICGINGVGGGGGGDLPDVVIIERVWEKVVDFDGHVQNIPNPVAMKKEPNTLQ